MPPSTASTPGATPVTRDHFGDDSDQTAELAVVDRRHADHSGPQGYSKRETLAACIRALNPAVVGARYRPPLTIAGSTKCSWRWSTNSMTRRSRSPLIATKSAIA